MRILRPRNIVIAIVLLPVVLAAFVVLKPAKPPAFHGSGQQMQAILYRQYGEPDVLHLEQTERPLPESGQVLVHVRAASVNPLDWHFMRGTPYLIRVGAGLSAPVDTRIGADLAGDVAAIGDGVTGWKVGDAVFGTAGEAFAEYARVSPRHLAAKPAGITYEQAAAVPVAAVTALQALRDHGHVQAGQKVLINGASGGVGTYMVQLARILGADVTGVCSGRNAELVRSLGAAHVVDYTKADFLRLPERYDVVIDNVGNHSPGDVRQVLTRHGTYVLVGGGGPDEGNWLGPLANWIKVLAMRPFVPQRLETFVSEITPADLQYLAGLMQDGKLVPVIDRTYTLAQTAEAVRYVEQGHAKGKVVLRVGDGP